MRNSIASLIRRAGAIVALGTFLTFSPANAQKKYDVAASDTEITISNPKFAALAQPSALVLGASLIARAAAAENEDAMKQLVPTGTLRVGVAAAPAVSAFFVTKDAAGMPHGVTADLGIALAEKLGVPVKFFVAPNSGELTDATAAAEIDVAFMPVDEERKKRVDFGPNYFLIESTYMATAASGAKTVADVDRAGMRVIGIAGTTTIRAAARTLKNTTISPVTSVGDAVAALRDGQADAFALSRDSLPVYVKQIPGSRIVDGAFQQTGIAIAVPKERQAALAYVTTFMEEAKANGLVRRALDAAGFKDDPVAPAAP
jgi:polar amino acid transport system substrate-binding protein